MERRAEKNICDPVLFKWRNNDIFLEYQLEIKQNIFSCLKVERESEKEEDIWF